MAPWSADPRAAAAAAALAPHAWQDLTEQMLARLVLAAWDRASVVRLLHSVPGVAVGEEEPMKPAETGDVRVEVLARTIRGRQWREFSLDRLCADLLTALDGWQARQDANRPLLDDR